MGVFVGLSVPASVLAGIGRYLVIPNATQIIPVVRTSEGKVIFLLKLPKNQCKKSNANSKVIRTL